MAILAGVRKTYVPITLSLLAYFTSGIGLTIYNKWLLSKAYYGFTYPIALILVHMTTNFLLAFAVLLFCYTLAYRLSCACCLNTNNNVHHNNNGGVWPGWKALFTRFAPVGILTGGDITLTNVAFQHASVSFVEVIKSGVPVLLFVFAAIAGRETVSASKVLLMLLMSSGIAITSAGELETEGKNFDSRGAIAAVLATICAAIRMVAIEALLGGKSERSAVATATATITAAERSTNGHNNDMNNDGHMNEGDGVVTMSSSIPSSAPPSDVHVLQSSIPHHQSSKGGIPHTLRVLLFIAPFAAITLAPIFFVVEWANLRASPFATDSSRARYTTGLILGGATMAFVLNMSELCLVRISSAMTMCVAGVTKFIMVLFLSTWWFDRKLTTTNWVGCFVTIVAVAAYNYVRIKRANALARTLAHNGTTATMGAIELRLSEEAQVLMSGRTDQYGQLYDDDSVPLPPLDDIELDLHHTGSMIDEQTDDDMIFAGGSDGIINGTRSIVGTPINMTHANTSNDVPIVDHEVTPALGSATPAARQLHALPNNNMNNHNDTTDDGMP